jgi:hypothetical protein
MPLLGSLFIWTVSHYGSALAWYDAGMTIPTFIPIMMVGGIAFGLGVGVIVGYFLGRRSRKSQVGFPVVPNDSSTHP